MSSQEELDADFEIWLNQYGYNATPWWRGGAWRDAVYKYFLKVTGKTLDTPPEV